MQAIGQLTIKQTTNTDHDNGNVSKNISQTVGTTLFGSQQHTIFRHFFTEAVTFFFQPRLGHAYSGFLIETDFHIQFMGKRPQTALTDILTKGAHVLDHFRRIAKQANRGGYHQKTHNDQKPPGIIDLRHPKFTENSVPEGAELISILKLGLVLWQHRTDNTGDTDK